MPQALACHLAAAPAARARPRVGAADPVIAIWWRRHERSGRLLVVLSIAPHLQPIESKQLTSGLVSQAVNVLLCLLVAAVAHVRSVGDNTVAVYESEVTGTVSFAVHPAPRRSEPMCLTCRCVSCIGQLVVCANRSM